jgi:hypothetical protein
MDKKPTKAGAKKKRIKFKVVEPKTKPKPKMPEKKKKIKFIVKKKEEPKPAPKKKKIKFVVKNTADKKLDALKKKVEEQSKKDGIKRRVLPTGEVQRIKPKPSELKRVAGLSKEQANKMDPAELFGKLPSELRLKILRPKETGIKVASEKLTPQQLIELDDIVDDLIGCEFYYRLFYPMDYIFSKKTKYMEIQEKRVDKFANQTAREQDKLFSGKLLKILEIMDKNNMLKGYDNLNKSFHNNDLGDTIGEIALEREDYFLGDHLGVDDRDEDGLFIPTSRTRSALKEYIDEYKEVKDRTIEKMKDFKL